jgi:hypothetical protein
LVIEIYKRISNNNEFDIMKENSDNKKLRILVLSTNVNDYDTGEPILEGSIRKAIHKNKRAF